jgi:DNA end-binding protein Ku
MPNELRDSHDYFDEIPDLKVPKDMLELAEHIVASKTADFNPAMFVDRTRERLSRCSRPSRPDCRPRNRARFTLRM